MANIIRSQRTTPRSSTLACAPTSPLAALATPAEYHATRTSVFPSETSVRWFIRQHRDELVKRGAFKLLTGRVFIVPDIFDAVVMGVGQEAVSSDWRARPRNGVETAAHASEARQTRSAEQP